MNLSLYVPDEHRPRLREIQQLARGAGVSISSEFMRFLDSRESVLRDACAERLARVMGDPVVENVKQAEIPADSRDPVERYLNRHAR